MLNSDDLRRNGRNAVVYGSSFLSPLQYSQYKMQIINLDNFIAL